MADWFQSHREIVFLLVGTSAVALPLWIGTLKGRLPRELFLKWALALTLATVGLATAIYLLSQHVDRWVRFALSILFALLWIAAGIQIGILLPRRNALVAQAPERTAKALGLVFLVFGILWLGLSLFRHFQ